MQQDSCGVGRSRGGLGFLRRYEILKEGVRFSLYSDRFKRAPEGLFGGGAGTTGYCEIVRGGQTIPLKSKDAIDLLPGDILTLAVGGGGGFGDPSKRSAERLREDLADQIISADRAASWASSKIAAE